MPATRSETAENQAASAWVLASLHTQIRCCADFVASGRRPERITPKES